jgi:hypothetical protein
MAQTHSVVDWFDYGQYINLDEIMNIGAKGTFKPIPSPTPDNGCSDGECCCVEHIDQLDNEILDKVNCPYEDPETGMLPPNCKYNDCRECPKCQQAAGTVMGAAKPKTRKSTKTTTTKTTKPRTKRTTKKTEN